MGIAALITGAIGLVKGWLNGKQKAQQAKQELAAAKAKALAQHLQDMDAATAAWNIKALETAGWRDEYLTIILSIPLIAVFFPQLVPYVKEGFAALATTPEWYKMMIGAMVSSAFGYQKLTDFMTKKQALAKVAG